MDPDKIQEKLLQNKGKFRYTGTDGKFLGPQSEEITRQISSNIKPCDVVGYLMKKKGADISELGDREKGVNAIPYRVCISKCGKRDEVVIGLKIIPFDATSLDPATRDQVVSLIRYFNHLLVISTDGKMNTTVINRHVKELKEAEKLILQYTGASPNVEARFLNAISLLNEGKTIRNTPHVMRSFMDFNCGLYKLVNKKSLDMMWKFNQKYPKHSYLPFGKVVMTEWANLKTLGSFLKDLPEVLSLSGWKWLGGKDWMDLQSAIRHCISVITFQIMYTLAVVAKHINGFTHNDLHFNNILVSRGPDTGYTKYFLNNKTYFVPNLGFDIKLWDFDISSSIDIPNGKVINSNKIEDDSPFIQGIPPSELNWRFDTEHMIRELRTISTGHVSYASPHASAEDLKKYDGLIRQAYDTAVKAFPDVSIIAVNNLIKPIYPLGVLNKILRILRSLTFSYSDSKICSRRTGWRPTSDGFNDVQKYLISLKHYHNYPTVPGLLMSNKVANFLVTHNGSYTGKKQDGMYTAAEFIEHARLDGALYFRDYRVNTVKESTLPFVKKVKRTYIDSTPSSIQNVKRALSIKSTHYGEGDHLSNISSTLQETVEILRTTPVVNTSRCTVM